MDGNTKCLILGSEMGGYFYTTMFSKLLQNEFSCPNLIIA